MKTKSEETDTEASEFLDRFAIAALSGLVAFHGDDMDDDELAAHAYSIASAMLNARHEWRLRSDADDPDAGAE